MKYTINGVYTYIATKAEAAVEGVYCSSRVEPTPPSFPAVSISEVSRMRPQQYATLANDDGQWISTFEVEIFSNLRDGARTQAYKVLYAIEDAFKELAYFEEFCEPVLDADPSIYRIVARFSRQLGEGDQIPTLT